MPTPDSLGPHELTVSYAGNSTLAATDGTRTVHTAHPTTLSLDVEDDTVDAGAHQAVTLSLTARTPNGSRTIGGAPVEISLADQHLATVRSGTAPVQRLVPIPDAAPIGKQRLTARYAPGPDAAYLSSSAESPTVLIRQKPVLALADPPPLLLRNETTTVAGHLDPVPPSTSGLPEVRARLAGQLLGPARQVSADGTFTLPVQPPPNTPLTPADGTVDLEISTASTSALASATVHHPVRVVERPRLAVTGAAAAPGDAVGVRARLAASTGEPLAGEPLELRHNGTVLTDRTTDADGTARFRIPVPPSADTGPLDHEVVFPGSPDGRRLPASSPADALAAAPTRIEVSDTDVPRDRATVEGTVHVTTDLPVRGTVEVTVDNATTQARPESQTGRFRVDVDLTSEHPTGPSPVLLRFNPTDPRLLASQHTATLTVHPGLAVHVTPTTTLVAGQSARLTGHLATDRGDPIAPASVDLRLAERSLGSASVEDTRFTWSGTLPAVPPGTHDLVLDVQGEDGASWERRVRLRVKAIPQLSLQVEETGSNRLGLVGHLATPEGRPIEGARVCLEASDGAASCNTTDDAGRVETSMPNAASGATIRALYDGGNHWTTTTATVTPPGDTGPPWRGLALFGSLAGAILLASAIYHRHHSRQASRAFGTSGRRPTRNAAVLDTYGQVRARLEDAGVRRGATDSYRDVHARALDELPLDPALVTQLNGIVERARYGPPMGPGEQARANRRLGRALDRLEDVLEGADQR